MHDSTTDAAVVPHEFWKSAIAGLNTLPGTRTPPDLFPTQLESVKWIGSKKATNYCGIAGFNQEPCRIRLAHPLIPSRWPGGAAGRTSVPVSPLDPLPKVWMKPTIKLRKYARKLHRDHYGKMLSLFSSISCRLNEKLCARGALFSSPRQPCSFLSRQSRKTASH